MRAALRITGALMLCLLGPLAAPAAGLDEDVELERTVRDDDRGVRAIVRYRPFVMTGGREEILNGNGTVTVLHWEGFVGQFEAEVIAGHLADDDAEAFLREAVVAVCPSVDADVLAGEWVQVSGNRLLVFAQCPAIDETLD